jgi:hypothetical protein
MYALLLFCPNCFVADCSFINKKILNTKRPSIFLGIFLLLSVVNGGYSYWILSKPCNVSCGDGMEI